MVSIPPRERSGAALERFAAAIPLAGPAAGRLLLDHWRLRRPWRRLGRRDRRDTTRTGRGLARLDDEAQWAAAAKARGAEADILRLAGIYGPGRNALVNLRAGQARRIVKPGQVFNRAHVDDIAEVTRLALTSGLVGQVWNVADEEPAAPQDVVAYAAGLLGLDPPPEEPFDPSRLSPMASRVLRRQQARLDRQGQGAAGIQARLSDLSGGAQGAGRGGRGPGVTAHAATRRPSVQASVKQKYGVRSYSALALAPTACALAGAVPPPAPAPRRRADARKVGGGARNRGAAKISRADGRWPRRRAASLRRD